MTYFCIKIKRGVGFWKAGLSGSLGSTLCDVSFRLELRLARQGKFSFIHPGPPVLAALHLHHVCMFSARGNGEPSKVLERGSGSFKVQLWALEILAPVLTLLILNKSLNSVGPQCADL